MRVLAAVLLTLSSAFAYEVTFPGGSSGWNTTGPNYLKWDRVATDPLNFTAVLTNVDTNSNQILANTVDGTLGIALCPPPDGGWPSGSGFRVNLAQDADHLNSLLAQSNQFNITSVSSDSSTTSSGTQTGTATSTSPNPVASGGTTTSSETSTTPTGTSAAPLSANSQVGVLTAVAAITALLTTIF